LELPSYVAWLHVRHLLLDALQSQPNPRQQHDDNEPVQPHGLIGLIHLSPSLIVRAWLALPTAAAQLRPADHLHTAAVLAHHMATEEPAVEV
jgi:hypothetical protein